MGKRITAIRMQKKNRRRASLYLDGKFTLGLSVEVVQDFGLRRGQVLEEADLDALRRAEQRQRAYRDALRLLSYRPRSVEEVRRRLSRRYDQEQVEAAIARLVELNLLDDPAFARSWVENRLDLSPRGRRALDTELRRKGVVSEVVQQVLDEALSEETEAGHALELARNRARAMAGLDRQRFFRRMQGFLARRGFSAEVVWKTVEQVWSELVDAEAAKE